MRRLHLALLVALPAIGCTNSTADPYQRMHSRLPDSLHVIKDIVPPPGYHWLQSQPGSFSEWLGRVPLRKDHTVYLYNGRPKINQSAQFAVLDISVGNEDLQQCADAVMRLRAEYLFSQERYPEIQFLDNAGHPYRWSGGNNHQEFSRYLSRVFAYCGTASLSRQLRTRKSISEVEPGDVFIKGGFPGHAMIVVAVAQNQQAERVFLLAQSYMPAQDIHIVVNPEDSSSNPWYRADGSQVINTPEWTFLASQLKTW